MIKGYFSDNGKSRDKKPKMPHVGAEKREGRGLMPHAEMLFPPDINFSAFTRNSV